MGRKKKRASRPRQHNTQGTKQPPKRAWIRRWTTPAVLIGIIAALAASAALYYQRRNTVATEMSTRIVVQEREAKMSFLGVKSSDTWVADEPFWMTFLFRNIGRSTARQVTARAPEMDLIGGYLPYERCERVRFMDYTLGGPRDVDPNGLWTYKQMIQTEWKSMPAVDPRLRVTFSVDYATDSPSGATTREEPQCHEAVADPLGSIHWFDCSRTPLPENCPEAPSNYSAQPQPQPAPVPQ